MPTFDDWRTNWTVGAAVSIPIMTGGRIKAEENAAKADIDESKARLQLAKELSDLDTASARAELRAARAEWDASGGTVQQAARAYEIAELRYREGLSTQLELSDSRLLLGQAQVNRARAGRDLQMTRVRYALLPDLPLGGTGAGADAGIGGRTGVDADRGVERHRSGGENRDSRGTLVMSRTSNTLTSAALALIVGAAAISAACGKTAASEAPPDGGAPAAVEIGQENIVIVEAGDISVGPLVSGELKAEREATVRAEIGGSLLQVVPQEGQAVRAGTLLARIEGRTLQEALDSAQSHAPFDRADRPVGRERGDAHREPGEGRRPGRARSRGRAQRGGAGEGRPRTMRGRGSRPRARPSTTWWCGRR